MVVVANVSVVVRWPVSVDCHYSGGSPGVPWRSVQDSRSLLYSWTAGLVVVMLGWCGLSHSQAQRDRFPTSL